MKWNDVYILVLCDPDYATDLIFNHIKKKYSVPLQNRFCLSSKTHLNGQFSQLAVNSLSKLSIHSKLVIISHGKENGYVNVSNNGYCGPKKMASVLTYFGLKTVGLITYKSCYAGCNSFLEKHLIALTEYGIKVGWLIGPTSWVSHIRFVEVDGVGLLDSLLRLFSLGRQKSPDWWRLNIIRGNAYSLPNIYSKRWG